jgi:hypothetical protein
MRACKKPGKILLDRSFKNVLKLRAKNSGNEKFAISSVIGGLNLTDFEI